MAAVRRAAAALCACAALVALAASAVCAQTATGASACTAAQYYDTTSLTCQACGTNQESPSSRAGCMCKAGYIGWGPGSREITVFDPTVLSCVACPTNQVASQDRRRCLSCASPATYDGTLLECTCPSASYRLMDKTVGGVDLSSKTCDLCANGSRVFTASDRYSCVACTDRNMTYDSTPSCVCDAGFTLANGACLPNAEVNSIIASYPISTATSVTYYDVIQSSSASSSSLSLTSQLFQDLFLWSVYFCRVAEDMQACNALANLCVLQTYLKTSSACAEYIRLAALRATSVNSFAGWPNGMPWLYYSTSADATLTSTGISMTVAFSATTGAVNRLTFVLSNYSQTGVWQGFTYLTTELQLCAADPTTGSTFLDFGTGYTKSCTYSITPLLTANSLSFYDMYVLDGSTLYPVPVRVLNYRENGQTVNDNTGGGSTANDVLTRRFFVTDSVSGKRAGDTNPHVMQFLSTATLTIRLQTSGTAKIYPPELSLLYSARTDTAILADTSLGSATVSFTATYTVDSTNFFNIVLILYVIVMAGAVVLWILRLVMWVRRHQSPQLGIKFAGFAVVQFLAVASTFSLIFLFLICSYLFVFFKLQTTVYLLLPDATTSRSVFTAVLLVSLFGKIMEMVYMMYSQTNVDMFFIDWEHSRGQLESGRKLPVSAWRTLFLANEWNEIQTSRRIKLPITILFVLFFLLGLGWEYAGTPQPSVTDLTVGDRSPLLRFCVSTFLWLVAGMIQIIWHFAIYRRYIQDLPLDFMDLMSVANLSLVIFRERFHGYYLHGRSVHSYTDTSLKEMHEMLRREEENTIRPRGLEDESDVQAFEMYVTNALRTAYDDIYNTRAMLEAKAERGREREGRLLTQPQKKREPGVQHSNELLDAHATLNHFLMRFVDRNLPDHPYVIMDKTRTERFFGSPPDILTLQKSVLYRDRGSHWFSSVLWSGEDFFLLLFNIAVYSAVDLGTNSPAIAAAVTYIVEWLLSELRAFFGRRNLGAKTLVDPRFLI